MVGWRETIVELRAQVVVPSSFAQLLALPLQYHGRVTFFHQNKHADRQSSSKARKNPEYPSPTLGSRQEPSSDRADDWTQEGPDGNRSLEAIR